MKYNNIKLSKSFVLNSYYSENNYLIKISFAKGYIYIDDRVVYIDKTSVVIIPKYHRICCNIINETLSNDIEISYISFSNKVLNRLFTQLSNKHKKNDFIQYKVPVSVYIERNFQIWKETNNIITDKNLKKLLIEQGLYFILYNLHEQGVDIQNIFNLNYNETKKEGIIRLVTKEPQKKWNLSIISKILFTTNSTLRRHLKKEGVLFSELILDIRMGLAINLLIFTNHSITQISNKTGFGSVAYFCYIFKCKYNITPIQFRIESRKNR